MHSLRLYWLTLEVSGLPKADPLDREVSPHLKMPHEVVLRECWWRITFGCSVLVCNLSLPKTEGQELYWDR